MSRPYIPRNQGLGEWDRRWDSFDDIREEGLAATDAFREAYAVHEDITPEGLVVDATCNCNERRALVVSWAEVTALSLGQNPSDPRISASPGWQPLRDERGIVSPAYRFCSCRAPAELRIDQAEARDALARGKQHAAADSEARRVYTLITGRPLG
jgi:hypothetical protein